MTNTTAHPTRWPVVLSVEGCNRTLPIFSYRPIPTKELQNLHYPRSEITKNLDFEVLCKPQIDCTGKSAIQIVLQHLDPSFEFSSLINLTSRIAALDADRPIIFTVKDNHTHPELFASLRSEVMALSISNCLGPRTTGKLPILNLPNLIRFKLRKCLTTVIVRRSDFAANCRLRVIEFGSVTSPFFEPETFTDLPELRHLALEKSEFTSPGKSCMDLKMRQLILKLHCDCTYLWLREWLYQNPLLIRPKLRNDEIYRIGDLGSEPIFRDEIFTPMDCLKRNFDACDKRSTLLYYTINDPC